MKNKLKLNKKLYHLISAIVLFFLLFIALISMISVKETLPTIEKWKIFSIELNGPSDGNPFTDVKLTAIFKHKKKEVKVTGFYNGNGKYIIRFSPDLEGKWIYQTFSNINELTNKCGSINCIKPSPYNHGPVKIINKYYFNYADGTPYFSVGTTCYAWIHQPKELQELTLKTLSSSPFNKLRMCIFPKSYIYNTNEPEIFPFVRNADSTFDFTKFNPVFWNNLEERIVELDKLGIQADIILFHPYDRWGFSTMDSISDIRYLRYAIARLAVYKNVWWSLANEFDFMTIPVRKNHSGNKHMEDWDKFFKLIQNEDPYQRLRSIHNGKIWYDHTKEWVTHASIQSSDLEKGIDLRKKYNKPIIFDECKYEGNIPNSWGKLTGQEMTRRFWIGAMNGCYVGHGETILDPNDILWWSKGGILKGESPIRIAFFRNIMEKLPFDEMIPCRQDSNFIVLSKPGKIYLVYILKPSQIKLDLEGANDFSVEYIDTWNMKIMKLKNVKTGEFIYNALNSDILLRIIAN
jgi:hypothetical protein